jgi:hypothetical protein
LAAIGSYYDASIVDFSETRGWGAPIFGKPLKMKYFAYGSNMSTPRLRARVPSCGFVTTAKLLGHQLCFHKRSNDKSSKCDAFHSGVDTDIIWGAVFNISAAEKKALDKAVGLGSGYNETTVDLITPAGEHLRAITYYADNTLLRKGSRRSSSTSSGCSTW